MASAANQNTIASLRARIQALDFVAPSDSYRSDSHRSDSHRSDSHGQVARFSIPEIDTHLPWKGLPRGCLHEILGVARPAAIGAATGFTVAMAARLAATSDRDGTILWCSGERLYPPGLSTLGLDPAQIIMVRAKRLPQRLWVLEEALRAGALTAVIGEIDDAGTIDLTASRRLQLAAQDHDTPCLLLYRHSVQQGTTAAVTRWQIESTSGEALSPSVGPAHERFDGLGPPRWTVRLLRCRGGAPPATWTLEWTHATGAFALVAPLADRPASPAFRQAG